MRISVILFQINKIDDIRNQNNRKIYLRKHSKFTSIAINLAKLRPII